MSIIEDMEVHIEIDQSNMPNSYPDTWWSIPAEQSADIFHQYEDKVAQVKCLLMHRAKKQRTENNEDDIMVMNASGDKELEVKVQYDCQWPEWKKGTKIVDGKATNISSYTLNFDTMEQKNKDTGFVRKFRIVNMLLPATVTFSDLESFRAGLGSP